MNHPTAKSQSGSALSSGKDAALKVDAPWTAPASPRDALQAEYDALADLFLSDDRPSPTDVLGTIGLAAGIEVPLAPARPEPLPEAIVTGSPPPVRAAAPAKVAPKAPAQVEEPTEPPAQAPGATIETLILGHLPVLASAWAAQYARHVAEATAKPVALVRVQGGVLSLEIVFADAESAAPVRARGPSADVAEALARAVQLAPRIMIRVDETSEPDLLMARGGDRATLLTGADDMAVVACYRTIKHICLDMPGSVSLATEDSGQDRASPIMGVAIMGADADKARAADQKIRRATLTFLGRGIDPATCVSRMAPSNTALLHRGPWSHSIEELLKTVRELWVRRDDRPAPREPRRPRQPAAEVGPAAIASSRTVMFAQRISGLTALSSRCPYCPAVELAVGEGGVLHLLAGAGGVMGGAAATEASQAIGQLLSAASWAEDHADLLGEAHPALKAGRRQGGPILHLLTDEPRAARSLLGTGVRIHLLTPVEVNGRQTWVCRDLN